MAQWNVIFRILNVSFFLESNEEKGHQPYVCISDHFVDAVKSGHLQVRPRVVEVGWDTADRWWKIRDLNFVPGSLEVT